MARFVEYGKQLDGVPGTQILLTYRIIVNIGEKGMSMNWDETSGW